MAQADPPDSFQTPANVNVRQAILKGGAWVFLGRLLMRGIGVISTIILARMLAPEDFGLVAICTVLVGLAEVIGRYGQEIAVIRRQNLDRDFLDSAWTASNITGLVLGVCVFASAPFIAGYFNEPRAVLPIQILSLRVFCIGLQNIGLVLYRRELDFSRDFTNTILEKFIPVTVTIFTAYFIRNYWALVIGNVVGFFGAIAASYVLHPYRPKICFKHIREVWSFSLWVLLEKFAFFSTMRIDHLFVPAVGNTAQLGHYHVGSDLGRMPVGELFMPLNRVLFPAYAHLMHQPGGLSNAYVHALSAATAICLPVSFGFALIAGDFTRVIYGAKWMEMVPVVELSALASGAVALIGVVTPVLLALGRSRVSAALICLQALLLLCGLLTFQGVFSGISDIAAVRLAAVLTVLPIALICVHIEISLSFTKIITAAWRPALAVLSMSLALLYVLPEDMNMPAALRLGVRTLAGAAVYCGVLFLAWLASGKPDGAERILLDVVRRR
jgi:lipopolysaccharide exporter